MQQKAAKINYSLQPKRDDYKVISLTENGDKTDVRLLPKHGNQPSSPEDGASSNNTSHNGLLKRIGSWRCVMVLLLHLSFVINILPVVTMSMSLVCMCGPVQAVRIDVLFNKTNETTIPYLDNRTLSTGRVKTYEFDWGSEMRGLLISGYLFTVFLVPHLSNVIRGYIGNKLTLTLFSAALAMLSFVAPVAARTNVHIFLVVRILTGLCINANVPISGDMMAWWIPEDEKLTCATFVIAGWIIGGAVGPLLSGFLCDVPVDNGWPLIFYFNGLLIVTWTLAWYGLSSRKPENHPFISESEKTYILAHRSGMDHATTQDGDSPPYGIIFSSKPVLAFLASGVCHLWAFIIILTCLPLYLTSVLKFSLQEAGIIFSVMSILRLPAIIFWSAIGNWLVGLKDMSTNRARKICFGLGQGLACGCCLAVSFLNDEHKWASTILVIASLLSSIIGTTMSSVIPLDMAPRYAGFLTGVGSSLSCLVALTAPFIATAVTTHGLYSQWRIVWVIMAVVNLSAGLIFLLFGDASLQPWATSKIDQCRKSAQTSSSSDSSDCKLSALLGNDAEKATV